MTNFIISSLTCYYLVRLFVYEDGPLDIFAKIRYFLGVNVEITDVTTGEVIDYEPNGSFFATMISCHVCASFWVAFLVSFFSGNVFLSFAVAGVSTILNEVVNAD